MLKLKHIYLKLKTIIMSEMYDELLPNEVLLMPKQATAFNGDSYVCLLYTSPSPRDRTRSRMPSSA